MTDLDPLCDAYDVARADYLRARGDIDRARAEGRPTEGLRPAFSSACKPYHATGKALSEAMFSVGLGRYNRGCRAYISTLSVDPFICDDSAAGIEKVIEEASP